MLTKECKYHGSTEYVPEGRSFRCKKCRSENVSKSRRKTKERLVKEFGSKCGRCGYNRYVGALEFHHLDPATKEFGIAFAGNTQGYQAKLEEAKKCILLCANCHREVEAGM